MRRTSFSNRDLIQRLGFSLLTLVALVTVAPILVVISSHSAAVRWSFHRIAGRRTLFDLSRNTEPCI
jgi:hypothetical protein